MECAVLGGFLVNSMYRDLQSAIGVRSDLWNPSGVGSGRVLPI